jgi:lysozyme
MKKITKIGKGGLDLIKSFEGLYLKPYLCPAGVPTIGYGSTYYENGKKITLKDKPITEARANEILAHELSAFEKYVDAFCQDNITQNQFDALVSFAYNVGHNALKSSTLLKKVNKDPNDPTIKDEFLKWCKADGTHNGKDDDNDGLIDEAGEKQTLKGLLRRRTAEAALYFTK